MREPSDELGAAPGGRRRGGAFAIAGTDYPTLGGTGMHGYIHVWDLARAHVAVVERSDTVLDEGGAPSAVLIVTPARA
ncbi:hypothetical protein [Nocardioides aurantiacus]|uniref:hypothetical protein n=1 Tax=Nocardioides aurantiacus TaxID=86796 RepID=UPI00403F908A